MRLSQKPGKVQEIVQSSEIPLSLLALDLMQQATKSVLRRKVCSVCSC